MARLAIGFPVLISSSVPSGLLSCWAGIIGAERTGRSQHNRETLGLEGALAQSTDLADLRARFP